MHTLWLLHLCSNFNQNLIVWPQNDLIGNFIPLSQCKSFNSKLPHFFVVSSYYRVSHIEMALMNWLWWIKICNLDLVSRWSWNIEIGNFWLPQPFFKKVTLARLNSLWQKGYQISVKNWIFDDPFHKKEPVLVVLVPGMIQLSGSGSFFGEKGFLRL